MRGPVMSKAVVAGVQARGLAEATWFGGQPADVDQAATGDHLIDALDPLERAEKHGAARWTSAHEVQAPIETEGAMDIGAADWTEHGRAPGGRASEAVEAGFPASSASVSTTIPPPPSRGRVAPIKQRASAWGVWLSQ